MSDVLATYDFDFEWDNGEGEVYGAVAQVEIRRSDVIGQLSAEVVALDVHTRDGTEASDRVMLCCDEKAQEIAWEKWDREQTGQVKERA